MRAEMVRLAERKVVKLGGVSVEYQPTQHVTEQEVYRLADAVRRLMLEEGLLVRGDFVIRSEKPR